MQWASCGSLGKCLNFECFGDERKYLQFPYFLSLPLSPWQEPEKITLKNPSLWGVPPYLPKSHPHGRSAQGGGWWESERVANVVEYCAMWEGGENLWHWCTFGFDFHLTNPWKFIFSSVVMYPASSWGGWGVNPRKFERKDIGVIERRNDFWLNWNWNQRWNLLLIFLSGLKEKFFKSPFKWVTSCKR